MDDALKALLNCAYKFDRDLYITIGKDGITIKPQLSQDYVSLVYGTISTPVPASWCGRALMLPCPTRAEVPKKKDTVELMEHDGDLIIVTERNGVKWHTALWEPDEDDEEPKKSQFVEDMLQKATHKGNMDGTQMRDLIRHAKSKHFTVFACGVNESALYAATIEYGIKPLLPHCREGEAVVPIGETDIKDKYTTYYDIEHINSMFYIPNKVPITVEFGDDVPGILNIDYGHGTNITYIIAPKLYY